MKHHTINGVRRTDDELWMHALDVSTKWRALLADYERLSVEVKNAFTQGYLYGVVQRVEVDEAWEEYSTALQNPPAKEEDQPGDR